MNLQLAFYDLLRHKFISLLFMAAWFSILFLGVFTFGSLRNLLISFESGRQQSEETVFFETAGANESNTAIVMNLIRTLDQKKEYYYIDYSPVRKEIYICGNIDTLMPDRFFTVYGEQYALIPEANDPRREIENIAVNDIESITVPVAGYLTEKDRLLIHGRYISWDNHDLVFLDMETYCRTIRCVDPLYCLYLREPYNNSLQMILDTCYRNNINIRAVSSKDHGQELWENQIRPGISFSVILLSMFFFAIAAQLSMIKVLFELNRREYMIHYASGSRKKDLFIRSMLMTLLWNIIPSILLLLFMAPTGEITGSTAVSIISISIGVSVFVSSYHVYSTDFDELAGEMIAD